MQIKLLKLLALLGAGDRQTSENMYSVLQEVLKRSDASANIGNAILYECICTITTINANARLLEMAAEITSRFLKVSVSSNSVTILMILKVNIKNLKRFFSLLQSLGYASWSASSSCNIALMYFWYRDSGYSAF